jgi:hypothetical protein
MAISGLVITLSEDAMAAEAAAAWLEADARVTLGERFGRRLAAVAETPSVEADRALWDELNAMAGVTRVDVTYVHLDSKTGSDERTREVDHASS